jgi:hypothetical protein
MVASHAKQASTLVTGCAVGNNSSATTPRNRLSSLVEGFSGSFASHFSNIWGNIQPLNSQQSNTLVTGDHNADQPAQLTGSTHNIATPQLPFRHQSTKSTSPDTSITSQPVLVRTYTRVERSRPSSAANPSVRGLSQSMPQTANLPSVDAFSFDGILRAIEPDINEAIDGIAEIYARSRLSLADEYGSHLPPQGEIMAPRMRHSGLAIRTSGLERTLTTVTEASSSSEKLAGNSKAGSVASGQGKITAYRSLRSIISKRRSSSHSSAPAETPTRSRPVPASWSISGDKESSITIKKQNPAPIQLSLASAGELPRDKTAPIAGGMDASDGASSPTPRRSTSWLAWRRSWTVTDHNAPAQHLDAESSLKNVLQGMGGLSAGVQ